MVRQFTASAMRSSARSSTSERDPITSPATTTATRPDPPRCSDGAYARNGTTNEMEVATVASSTSERTNRLTTATSTPTTTATPTACTKSRPTCQNDTEAPVAATAVRSSTSAVASLRRLSPSSTVTSRGATPVRRTIDVATASVGLTIAPSANASANPMPGMSRGSSQPSDSADTRTSTTDRPLMALKSRRKSTAGMFTDAAYSSGGSTPARIASGGTSMRGMPGRKRRAAAVPRPRSAPRPT